MLCLFSCFSATCWLTSIHSTEPTNRASCRHFSPNGWVIFRYNSLKTTCIYQCLHDLFFYFYRTNILRLLQALHVNTKGNVALLLFWVTAPECSARSKRKCTITQVKKNQYHAPRGNHKKGAMRCIAKSAPTLKGIVNNDAACLENAHDNLVGYVQRNSSTEIQKAMAITMKGTVGAEASVLQNCTKRNNGVHRGI